MPDVAPLWRPSPERIERARITAFRRFVEAKHGRAFPDYEALHAWSVEEAGSFWGSLFEWCDVVHDAKASSIVLDVDTLPGAKWFPGATLNFVDNVLRRRDGGRAIVAYDESGKTREITFAELRTEVGQLQAALAADGVDVGDRVAAYLPNVPEAVVGALAAASLGAVWSSASPDFGTRAVLDRFGQIAPKVLVAADRYVYDGKTFDLVPRLREIASALPSVQRVVVVSTRDRANLDGVPNAVPYEDYVGAHSAAKLDPRPLAFDHPLYVLYSSGTTGVPKCIVHGAGGTLLQHLKEHRLHTDVGKDDVVFYFTTCGWMMWNWLLTALGSDATVLLYDGAALARDGRMLFDIADAEGVTVFGTSAKYLAAVEKHGVRPAEEYRLEALKTVLSTGSPLSPASFDYVYRDVKADVCLSSISGGTDIVSCFVLGNPTLPVYRGEIQCAGLGMDVQVFDDAGRAKTSGTGELVCTTAFPSMPIGFYGDDGSRFRSAYFARWEGVWHHGDWAERTARGGFVIHGRSDATLNPGGVRIGSAEIYRIVEQFEEVLECVAVGQEWDGDVRIVLFVRLRPGSRWDDALQQTLRRALREQASPRHVPARILKVDDLPRTKNGKISELAVRDAVHGRDVNNADALANPESLALFRNVPELQT